jgi:hypothetical protein
MKLLASSQNVLLVSAILPDYLSLPLQKVKEVPLGGGEGIVTT